MLDLKNIANKSFQDLKATFHEDSTDTNHVMPLFADVSDIPESEKQYYQPDEYYVYRLYPDDSSGNTVIPFEKRKGNSTPSSNGLYVPEILMLFFCSNFPNPKHGYPGYWWFSYGVRNVGKILDRLKDGGFIEIDANTGKFTPTALGIEEMANHPFIEFAHKNRMTTNVSVWDINELVHKNPSRSWIEIFCEAAGESQEWVRMKVSRINHPEKNVKPGDLVPQQVKERIPLERVRNQDDFISAYDEGSPHYKIAEEFRLSGEIYKAVEEYDLAREAGFLMPALYWGYALAFRKIKDFGNETAILEEGIAVCNQPGMETSYKKLKDRLEKAKSLYRKQNGLK